MSMEQSRQCLICDKQYTPKASNQKYCSDDCYRKSRVESSYHKEWRTDNRDKVDANKRRYLDRLISARREIVSKLFAEQRGLCYLCRLPLERLEGKGAACIDHDHDCCPRNKYCARCIRGLACRGCNIILGYAKDDPSRLHMMASNLSIAKERLASPEIR